MRTRAKEAAQSGSCPRVVAHVTGDSRAIAECLASALAADQTLVMQAIQHLGRGGVDETCGLADLAGDVPYRRAAKLPQLRQNRVLQIAALKTKPLHRPQRTTPVVDGQSPAIRQGSSGSMPLEATDAGVFAPHLP